MVAQLKLIQQPIKTAYLTRLETSSAGTFGKISIGKITLFTGELPWKNNRQEISCIPEGTYKCSFTYSEKFNCKRYEVQGVYGRNGIRIHPANLMGDRSCNLLCELDGCIALGYVVGQVNGQKAILRSKNAVTLFEQFLDGKDFTLVINSVFDQPQRVI